jgi:hypothetical protein
MSGTGVALWLRCVRAHSAARPDAKETDLTKRRRLSKMGAFA